MQQPLSKINSIKSILIGGYFKKCVKQEELMLTKAAELKFLKIIDPTQNRTLQLLLKYSREKDGTLSVAANLLTGTLICFKLKALFVMEL